MSTYHITVQPNNLSLQASEGENLLQILQKSGIAPDAPCGGNGQCRKCRVYINNREVLACQTLIHRDMTVRIPEKNDLQILTHGFSLDIQPDGRDKYVLSYDIGTTTIVCYLLDGYSGIELAQESLLNPQTAYGADVISRIEYVMKHGGKELQNSAKKALTALAFSVSEKAGITPSDITLACVVGNTAMHHLFLGIDPAPLTIPPYMPNVSKAMEIPAAPLLPVHPDGKLRILPNIAGFVGADTVGCMTAIHFDELEKLTLMIDIGTNGEMVLGDRNRRIACSTAAGPAFEGAKISCGMRGAPGAIDHVTMKDGQIVFHTIDDLPPKGICGSGLLDLTSALLDTGILSESGILQDKIYPIGTSSISLTQQDISEVQFAKSAIRSGIELLTKQLHVTVNDINKVYLAGAFGNYMNPASACRIGMIPSVLLDRIEAIGNAAGEGAKRCALNRREFVYTQALAARTEFLELASCPEFQDCYIDHLMFEEDMKCIIKN